MKAVVRSLEDPSLVDGVNRLRVLSYPQIPETRDFDFYSFIYRWFRNHPLGDEMHRWVAVADGQVVGHLAATPQYYRINGQRVVAHTPADYIVHPRHGFQAFSLMRRFFRTTENCVACDVVPAVIEVETRLGAGVAGQLQYAAKLLNVAKLPAPSVPASLRRFLSLPEEPSYARGYATRPGAEPQDAEEHVGAPRLRPRAPIPSPVKWVINTGLQAADAALGATFGGRGLKVEALEGFDESFDELFEKVVASVPCVPEKDSAFLRWRYGPSSPQYPVTILNVKGGGTLLGYAVIKMSSVTNDDGSILDLTTLPGRHDVARALLREAALYLRQAGAHIIRYRFGESPTSPRPSDLQRLGFFLRKDRRDSLLVKFADPSLRKVAENIANWSYSVGDGEASFWFR